MAKSIGQQLVEGLEDFTQKLKAGVPIEATQVTVEHTPDGTLTTRRRVVLNVPELPSNETE